MNQSPILQPVFLVGAERSGTTVLRLMLDHHPDIAWCNEFEYVVDQVSASGTFPHLQQYVSWLEMHRIFQATGFVVDASLSYPEVANSFLQQKRDRAQKTFVGATVHRHFDRLLYIWSDAKFIHLVRDGRDVARSCIGMGWSGNVWFGVERWLAAERLWEKLCRVVPAQRRLEVQYETLILEPATTLDTICRFIGVSYDSAMLAYAKDTTYDLPNAKFLKQWESKLSELEIRLVESRIGDLLKKHKYELSGLPPLEVTPLKEKQLHLQDWWFRAGFRIKRYGLILFLADYLSRSLGLEEWQKSTKLKINNINRAYLK